MPSKKFLRESRRLVLAALAEIVEGSAYDVMDIVAAGKEGNEAFALRQRVSGACSELHTDNRVHKVGTKVNPSSGEIVNVYKVNPEPGLFLCPCGACPGGGDAGYKAKYEAVIAMLETFKAEGAPLCGSCQCILCDNCKRARKAHGKAA
jgi:hypothetical protein